MANAVFLVLGLVIGALAAAVLVYAKVKGAMSSQLAESERRATEAEQRAVAGQATIPELRSQLDKAERDLRLKALEAAAKAAGRQGVVAERGYGPEDRAFAESEFTAKNPQLVAATMQGAAADQRRAKIALNSARKAAGLPATESEAFAAFNPQSINLAGLESAVQPILKLGGNREMTDNERIKAANAIDDIFQTAEAGGMDPTQVRKYLLSRLPGASEAGLLHNIITLGTAGFKAEQAKGRRIDIQQLVNAAYAKAASKGQFAPTSRR
jgi:hypothetical protein